MTKKSKHQIAPREILKRQGNFRKEGMPLTEQDQMLIKILTDRAKELGFTPRVSDVREAAKIKGRFRCWKDAIQAAGLPSERDPEQVEKRMAFRNKMQSEICSKGSN